MNGSCPVSSCYATGSVTGSSYVGGLVGRNSGRITTSYGSGMVTGDGSVGGLVGYNRRGSIATSYSTGAVSGEKEVGGFVGRNGYGEINSSLWDMEASGLSMSDGGVGKTTAEMQTASTFLEVGWDFVGESENGVEDIWWIDEGVDYPRLCWERLEGEF